MSTTDVVGIAAGFLFLFTVLGVAGVLRSRFRVNVFVTRKIVHICVAHWWLIAIYFHDSAPPALVGPIVFTVLNYISYRRRLFPMLEYRDRTANLGTVYFPIALIALVALSFTSFLPLSAGAVGVFVMGYGDGMAAVVGRLRARRTYAVFGNRKSYLGSAVMFTMSSLVVATITVITAGDAATWQQMVSITLMVALVATVLEAATPFGVDNLSVPIVTTIVYGVLAATLTPGAAAAAGATAAVLPLETVVGAFGLNAVVAYVAWYKHAVSGSGALAGFSVGTFLFCAGPAFWGLLMLFFISSTLIGKVSPTSSKQAAAIHEKGGRRDAGQVAANAGLPAIAAAAFAFGAGEIAVFAVVAGLAAATADTWSSEIGMLSRKPPVSILTFRPVPMGISGGVSTIGLVAGFFGALVMAICGALAARSVGLTQASAVMVGVVATGSGLFGTLLDSVLGATVQARFRRPDGTLTEKPAAADGVSYTPAGGLTWVNNDAVNLVTVGTVTVLAVVLAL